MSPIRMSLSVLAVVALLAAMPAVATADDAGSASGERLFSLQATPQDDGGDGGGAAGGSWDVEGPVSMRGADVQELGTMDFKTIFDYGTSSDGSDDDVGNRVEVQWGFLEGHEMVLKLPLNYGDGEDGNYDLSVGWQWKLHEGDGSLLPAFAIYNELRTPSGYHSSGFDWEIRGVFTWDVNPGTCRLHLNPFVRFMDTDNLESNLRGDDDYNFLWGDDDEVSGRHFAAGGVIGFDGRLSDSTIVNIDYIIDSGRLDGDSLQHSMEAGMDYQVAENHTLSWATRWTLDGDDQGDNWGLALSWICTWGNAPRFGWGEYTLKYPKLES